MSEIHEALLRLEGNTDFKVVVEHLEGELDKAHSKCLKADGVNLSRAQGRGGFILGLLDKIKEARNVVNKAK